MLKLLLLVYLTYVVNSFHIFINQNVSENNSFIRKVKDILETIHKIDYKYSNHNATLEINYIDSDIEWQDLMYNIQAQHQPQMKIVAFFLPSENTIYYSKNGLTYDTIIHEYFHFMSEFGFNESILYDFQKDINDDYNDYMLNHTIGFPYWKLNYREFSAKMFSLWFNTVFTLEIDGKDEYVYDKNKTELLNNISPRTLKRFESIYGVNNICELIKTLPDNDIRWCNPYYNANIIILRYYLEIYIYCLINILNLYYILYIYNTLLTIKNTAVLYVFLSIAGTFIGISYIGLVLRLLNFIEPIINLTYGISFVMISLLVRLILWQKEKHFNKKSVESNYI